MTTRTAEIIAIASVVLLLGSLTSTAATNTCQPRVRSLNGVGSTNTAVAVYWDRSTSMSQFRGVVREIVDTLDSAILPQAGAGHIVHMSVGSVISPMHDALPALNPDQHWTALHAAAERGAGDLALEAFGAVIYVSDMMLEIPDKERRSKEFACPGVAMPSKEHAGAIFGRCFSAGLKGRKLPALYGSVFKVTVKGGSVYVLVIGTNVELAREIDRGMQVTWQNLKAGRFIIADTANAVNTGQVSCSWSQESFRGLRLANAAIAGECRFRCNDEAMISIMKCGLRPPNAGMWMVAGAPAARSLPSAVNFCRTTEVNERGVTIQVQCPKLGKYVTAGTTLIYPWKTSMPSSVSSDADVRRLFDSTLKAFAAAVPERSTEVTFDVQ